MRFREASESMVRAIENQAWIDTPSYKLEYGLALTFNLLGGASTRVRNLLHGTWLGHPLHPMLTDVPIGAASAALVLDGASAGPPGWAGSRDAATFSVGITLLGGTAAALSGITDWQFTHDKARRSGIVHGVLNLGALGVYAVSFRQRRRGAHASGAIIATFGYAMLLTSSYLGGTLVYRHRIGVDHSVGRLEPRDYVGVLDASELEEDEPRTVAPEGVAIVLVRHAGEIHAISAVCPHLGGPLDAGWVHGRGLVCPWHGSEFDMRTGAVVRGPATAPVPCFQTRVRDGQIEVRRALPVTGADPGRAVVAQRRGDDAG